MLLNVYLDKEGTIFRCLWLLYIHLYETDLSKYKQSYRNKPANKWSCLKRNAACNINIGSSVMTEVHLSLKCYNLMTQFPPPHFSLIRLLRNPVHMACCDTVWPSFGEKTFSIYQAHQCFFFSLAGSSSRNTTWHQLYWKHKQKLRQWNYGAVFNYKIKNGANMLILICFLECHLNKNTKFKHSCE